MERIMNSLAAVLLFLAITKISGLDIVKPYPMNHVLIEGEPVTIACSAADSSGYPTVNFKKKSDDGSFEEINQNASIYIKNASRHDQAGLYTTTAMLHITKVRFPEDGNPRGQSYKCRSSLGSATEDFEFAIYAVKKSDLPRAVVKGTTVAYGGAANLTCDIIFNNGNLKVKLKRVEWIKNSFVIGQGVSMVDPITITKATTRDGGDYVCVAEVVLLRTRTTQIIMGTATLNVQLKMLDGDTQVTGNISDSVVMECPAEGYPLNVTWFRVNDNGLEVKLSEVPRIKDRIVASRPCSYCRYRVTMKKLESRDEGHYVCAANTNTESARHHIKLYVQTERNESEIMTTSARPTTVVIEHEPTPSKSKDTTAMIISTSLGILLCISLLIIGCLFYKLQKNRTQNSTKETDITADTPPENIEIVTLGHKTSSNLELQAVNEDGESKEAEEVQDDSDSTKMIKDGESGSNKELTGSDIEGKCSSQCDSFKAKTDQGKYAELPPSEEPKSKTPAEPHNDGYCSLM